MSFGSSQNELRDSPPRSGSKKTNKGTSNLSVKKDVPQNLNHLGKALEIHAKIYDKKNAICSERQITHVGHISKVYIVLEKLVLSGNSISKLEGIEQLPRLKILDLSDNNIQSFTDLSPLKNLSYLENLNLEGNPVVNTHNYRYLALMYLGTLKILDEKKISAEERKNSEAKLKNQFEMLEILLANYCELIQLQSFMKKLEVHEKLLNFDRKYSINFVCPDWSRFKKLFCLQNLLDEKSKNSLRANLLQDIKTIQAEIIPGKEMEDAFTHLKQKQKEKIQEFYSGIEKKIVLIKSVAVENQKKFRVYHEKKNSSEHNTSTSSVREGKSKRNEERKTQGAMNQSDIFEQNMPLVRSPSGNLKKSEYNASGTKASKSQTGGTMKNSQKTQSIVSPKEMKDQLDKAVRDKLGINMSPGALSTRKKEQIIDTLVLDLNLKEEELLKTEEQNKLLRGRLREFQTQNEDNVRVAKEEIFNMNLELDKNKAVILTLEKEMGTMQNKLNELVLRNFELERETTSMKGSQYKLKNYEEQLMEHQQQIEKYEIAREFYEKNIMRRIFYLFQLATSKMRLVKGFNKTRIDVTPQLVQKCFVNWQRYFLTQKIIRSKNFERHMKKISLCFNTWSRAAKLKKNLGQFSKILDIRKTIKAFTCWNYYINQQRQTRDNEAIAVEADKIRLLRKAYKSLYLHFVLYYLPESKELTLANKGQNFLRLNIKKKCFSFWKFWTSRISVPKNRRHEALEEYRSQQIMRNVLKRFSELIKVKAQNDYLTDEIDQKRKQILTKKILMAWKNLTPKLSRTRKIIEISSLMKKIRVLRLWRKITTEKREKQILRDQLYFFYLNKLRKRALDGMKLNVLLSSNKQEEAFFFREKADLFKMAKIFALWRATSYRGRNQKIMVVTKSSQLIHQYFKNWRVAFQLRKQKKDFNQKAKTAYFEKFVVRLKQFLSAWKSLTKRSRRNEEVIKNFQIRQRQRLLKSFLISLQCFSREKIKYINRQAAGLIKEWEFKAQEAQEFIEKMRQEKAEIQEKSGSLMLVLNNQQQELKQNAEIIEEFKGILQDSKKNEEILERSLKNKEENFRTLSEKYSSLQDELERSARSFFSEIDNLKKENSFLKENLNTARDELENQKSHNDRVKEELTTCMFAAENSLNEFESRFNQERREKEVHLLALQKKEKEVNEANELIKKLEKELDFCKNNLHSKSESEKSLKSLLEAKLPVMEQNKSKLEALERENLTLKQNNDKYLEDISGLSMLVKKYEYEIEMLKGNTLKATKSQRSLREDNLLSNRAENISPTSNLLKSNTKKPNIGQSSSPNAFNYGKMLLMSNNKRSPSTDGKRNTEEKKFWPSANKDSRSMLKEDIETRIRILAESMENDLLKKF